MSKIIAKPWGKEEILFDNGKVRTKIIEINKGEKLSLQYHKEKMEFLTYIDGKGSVIIGNEKRDYYEGSDTRVAIIAPNTVHRFMASKEESVRYLEMSIGSDEDIVRLEDSYGRTK